MENKSSIVEKKKNDISISMIFNKPKTRTTVPMKSLLGIDDRKVYNWALDESVTKCAECKTNFTFIQRKHHCRNCGQIFCQSCSNLWIEIPGYINSAPNKQTYWSLSSYLEYFNLNKNKERVCRKCYEKIRELKELLKTMQIFDYLPLDINDFMNLSRVCKTWYKIYSYYISFFKEILYRLPDHIYSRKEIFILDNNWEYFKGHSRWIVQVLLSMDWEKCGPNRERKLINMIKSNRKYNSCRILCNKLCHEHLTPEEVIICLFRNIYNLNIINVLLDILDEIGEIELLCYLPYIVFNVRHYKKYPKIVKCIVTFLLKKSTNSIEFCNQLFSELTQSIKDVEYQVFYKTMRKNLVDSLDKDTYKLFLNGYDFTQNIIEIISNSQNPKEDIAKHLNSNKYHSKNKFCLPININNKFNGIDIPNIKTIYSKTKPIILPCIYNENNQDKTFEIMLKHEDIRKEAIVMNIIKLMDMYLKRDLGLDLNIVTYNILPISNDYGYIEFVTDSYTLYSIREEENFSIQNFIMEKNPKITAGKLRDNFTKSCAAYCVITYLLGIGDRHLDNIMINDRAHIFNIDFGYIMGKDPKILSPEFRITPEMIDAMGGPNSKYYADFQNYCYRAYNCLRRHTSTFYVLLSLLYKMKPPLQNTNLTKEYIKNQIMERFIPGENYEEAVVYFEHKINKNSNTYSGNIIDYFHKQCKTTNSNSGTHSGENLINSAKNAWDVTTNITYSLGSNLKNLFWKG